MILISIRIYAWVRICFVPCCAVFTRVHVHSYAGTDWTRLDLDLHTVLTVCNVSLVSKRHRLEGLDMKVRVVVTLDVDTAGWEQDYGVAGAAAIRQDVQAYVSSLLSESNENFQVVK